MYLRAVIPHPVPIACEMLALQKATIGACVSFFKFGHMCNTA